MRQPRFMAKVVEAVDVGDDELLWRCLRETLRFRNINFGPLRLCVQDFRLEAEGGSVLIRKGQKVLASTQSAMFDRRRVHHPHVFDSARPDQDYLSFGVGQHWCIGAYIAKAQLTQMFKALFKRFEVRPCVAEQGGCNASESSPCTCVWSSNPMNPAAVSFLVQIPSARRRPLLACSIRQSCRMRIQPNRWIPGFTSSASCYFRPTG